jgi:hypothetical protein
MTGLGATLLSVMMLATLVLAARGIYLIAKRRDRKKGMLMLVAGAVMVGNVLIWTL